MSNYKIRVNIDELIDINNRLNILNNNIKNNAYTEFKIEANEFNLVDESNKNIITTNFYINHLSNSDIKECFICYEKPYMNRIKILSCKHYLCVTCYDKWDSTCNYNKRSTSCPYCRK